MIQAKVVMLPKNNKKPLLAKYNPYNKLVLFGKYASIPSSDEDWQGYELYFTTDEPIKEGDCIYVVNSTYNIITTCTGIEGTTLLDGSSQRRMLRHCLKVVAATDTDRISIDLPAIPQSFLQTYVESNGKIDSVWLEQEEFYTKEHVFGSDSGVYWELKLTDNNEVYIVEHSEGYSSRVDAYEAAIDKLPYNKDKDLEDAARLYSKENTNSAHSNEYGLFKGYKAGFKAAEEKIGSEFKKDLLDAISHIDAIDCMVGISSTRTQDLEGVVEKLKLSLRNLRDIWQRNK